MMRDMAHDTQHGGQPHAVARQLGLPAADFLDFSANINPDGPPPGVLDGLRDALGNAGTLTRYPDLGNRDLKQALSAYVGVSPEQIVVASGFVSLLEAALRVLPIRSCVVPVPAFNEYRRCLEQDGVDMVPLPLRPDQGFAYATSELLGGSADAILLANPQNPTGVLASAARLTELVDGARRQGKFVLLDEAFIDYAPADSMTPLVEANDHLIVFRSLTKCFAIPGLRVAYAVAAKAVAGELEEHVAPWSVTTLASVGAIAALGDRDYIAALSERNRLRREVLREGLRVLGVATYPGAANYLLARLPAGVSAADLWRSLAARGFLLRACDNFEGLGPGHLRLAVRSDSDNALLLRELRRRV